MCASKAAALATMAESLILAHSQGRLVYLFSPVFVQVIVLFAGINDIIHGWATSTVLRRFQRFYQHLQQKNPTAKIAIAGILPKRRNRWYAWSKEEEEQLKQDNASAKIVNWRLSELSTAIRGLNFISLSEFSESSDHLLARDGLKTSHEGTYIVAKKFRRVCRELTTVPIVSVPTKNSPLVPTIASVNTKTSVPVLQSCSEPTETSDSESISPMHVPTSDSVMTNNSVGRVYIKPFQQYVYLRLL